MDHLRNLKFALLPFWSFRRGGMKLWFSLITRYVISIEITFTNTLQGREQAIAKKRVCKSIITLPRGNSLFQSFIKKQLLNTCHMPGALVSVGIQQRIGHLCLSHRGSIEVQRVSVTIWHSTEMLFHEELFYSLSRW